MSRLPIVAALTAAALAAPVLAQDAPITLAAWSTRVESALDHNLYYPTAMGGRIPGSGVVRVKFNCSESGRPDKVSLFTSSGDPDLDSAALRSVRRIASLHPLPDGMGHGQQYVATILYARSYEDYDGQIARMRAAAVKNNAWFKGPATIALLGNGGGAGN